MMIKKSVNAKVVDKRSYDYFQCPGKIPEPKGLYEADFMTDDGTILTFEISVFDYQVLEIGQSAILTYQSNSIISFGDIIKDFKM